MAQALKSDNKSSNTIHIYNLESRRRATVWGRRRPNGILWHLMGPPVATESRTVRAVRMKACAGSSNRRKTASSAGPSASPAGVHYLLSC
jgi:hypothetical protein